MADRNSLIDARLPRGFEDRAPADIARALNLSAKTVANYHTLIKQKLGVVSDIELMRMALHQDLLEPRSGR